MVKPKIIFYIVVVILTTLIFFRYYELESKMDNQEYLEENISLIGRVVKEPDIRDNNIKLTIKAWPVKDGQAFLENKDYIKILATVERYPEYNYGDGLKITGKIQEPMVFEDFDYKNYLKKDKISAVVYYPKVERFYLEPTLTKYIIAPILNFKNKLRNKLHYHIPLPQGYVLAALVLGDKSRISQNFKEKLNIAGLRHLTAVSGLHIVLVSSILMSFFCFFLKRPKAACLSLLFILFFIVLTGFQVSSIRALIVGSLFLVAPVFGRKSLSLRSIVFAGLIMLLINPFLLFYDIGFQLSFLAALGIILLSPILNKELRFVPNKFLGFREILSATLAAYIFTLPILVYNFGQASLAGLVSNLLVLPIIPLVMLSGLLFVFLSVFLPPLGFVLSFFVWFILSYIILVVSLFSQPFFVQEFEVVSFGWVLISYIILFLISFYLYKKNKVTPWFLN